MLAGISVLARAEPPAPTPSPSPDAQTARLEIPRGATLRVQHGDVEHQLKDEATLFPGDVLDTDGHPKAVVRFQDGAELELSEKTRLRLVASDAARFTVELTHGRVRGRFKKIKEEVKKKSKDSKPRFILRTKAAVLGVRGTEFVASALANADAQFHTLEGTVEVAKSSEALLAGEAAQVPAGQFVAASEATGVTAPQTFDIAQFESSLDQAFEPGPAPTEVPAPPASAGAPAVPSVGFFGGLLGRIKPLRFEGYFDTLVTSGGGGQLKVGDYRGWGLGWAPEIVLFEDFLSVKLALSHASLRNALFDVSGSAFTINPRLRIEPVWRLILEGGPVAGSWQFDGISYKGGLVELRLGLKLDLLFVLREVFIARRMGDLRQDSKNGSPTQANDVEVNEVRVGVVIGI